MTRMGAPPIEYSFQNALPAVLQGRKVEIQDVLELRVEWMLVRADTAVVLVADPRLHVVVRIRRIPQEILTTLVRIAVLQTCRLSLAARTRAEEVAILKLLLGTTGLTAPVFDLHGRGLISDSPHAIAAKPALIRDQRLTQCRLVR